MISTTFPTSNTDQPFKAVDVTPSDTAYLASADRPARGLFVGTGGTVYAQLVGDTALHVYKNVASGTNLRGMFVRVGASTTAADILALF